MRLAVAFICLLVANPALAAEVYLLGSVVSCTRSSEVTCEIKVKKTEFKSKAARLQDTALLKVTANKEHHIAVKSSTLRMKGADVRFKIIGQADAGLKVPVVFKKDQIVILAFQPSSPAKPVAAKTGGKKSKKGKVSVAPTEQAVAGSGTTIRKRTIRTPAKSDHVLHQSVNQLSPGRESAVPDVDYGGPSTYADIEIGH